MANWANLKKNAKVWFGSLFFLARKEQLPTKPSSDLRPRESVVPYDVNLLDKTKALWMFGDFEALVSVKPVEILGHPHREKIAAYIAAAHQQTGSEADVIQQWYGYAKDWGCSGVFLLEISFASAHVSLASAKKLLNDERSEKEHLGLALQLSNPGVPIANVLASAGRAEKTTHSTLYASRLIEPSPASGCCKVGLSGFETSVYPSESLPLQTLTDLNETLKESVSEFFFVEQEDKTDYLAINSLMQSSSTGFSVFNVKTFAPNKNTTVALAESVLSTDEESSVSGSTYFLGEKFSDSYIQKVSTEIPREDFIDSDYDILTPCSTKSVLIVFSTPRCGSTYLCDLLRNNALCLPHEYFQTDQYLPILAKRWGCLSGSVVDCEKYVESLCANRTMSSGCLGINLHSHHIKTFSYFKKYFPKDANFKYMHLIRRDTVSQAISYEIAAQTGQWTNFFEKKSDPVYDAGNIQSKIKQIENGNKLIATHLSDGGFNYSEIYYEDLVAQPLSVVSKFFPPSSNFSLKTALKTQGAQLNSEWKRRFLSGDSLA